MHPGLPTPGEDLDLRREPLIKAVEASLLDEASWGDGTCRQCREGNEYLCSGNGRWVGFGPPGGFAEYMAVEYRHAVPVSAEAAKKPELLAPMTDAGMTPYRGMRKLRDAGKLGPGRTAAVTGSSASQPRATRRTAFDRSGCTRAGTTSIPNDAAIS